MARELSLARLEQEAKCVRLDCIFESRIFDSPAGSTFDDELLRARDGSLSNHLMFHYSPSHSFLIFSNALSLSQTSIPHCLFLTYLSAFEYQ